MTALETIHGAWIYGRRVRRLGEAFDRLMPRGARALDIGCGDGLLTRLIQERRPDVSLEGIDVLARPDPHVPVTQFDGRTIPFADKSFDVAMLVDVLHHAEDARRLLGEAARVARQCVLIKDHLLEGLLARETLEFMDRMGNARYNVALPFHYWTRAEWEEAFRGLGLRVTAWEGDVGLYAWPLSMVFGRGLHFVARLEG